MNLFIWIGAAIINTKYQKIAKKGQKELSQSYLQLIKAVYILYYINEKFVEGI